MAKYAVNLQEIRRAFADPANMPPLFEEFAEFLSNKPQGSLGDFELSCGFLDDSVTESGNDIAEHFAMVFAFPDGAQMGFWFAQDASNAPLVLFPHDDAPYVIASDFADFLTRLTAVPDSDGELPVPSDFWPDEERASHVERHALLAWWDARCTDRTMSALDDISWAFDHFIENATTARSAWLAAQPEALAIANLLKPYALRWVDGANRMQHLDRQALQEASDAMAQYVRPEDQRYLPQFDQAWLDELTRTMAGHQIPEVDLLEIQVAGRRVDVLRRDAGQLWPIPEADAVAPLILALRLAQAKLFPARGLWFAATLTITEQTLDLRCDFRCRPVWVNSKSFDAHLDVDLTSFPRSAFWRLG